MTKLLGLALLCVSLWQLPAVACVDVPQFNGGVDASSFPARPPSPVSAGELETYRHDWEAARELIIEGFNRRRILYGERLLRLEANALAQEKEGSCSTAETAAVLHSIAEELLSIHGDAQLIYDDLIRRYRSEIAWYALILHELRVCLAVGRCRDGGYSYVV